MRSTDPRHQRPHQLARAAARRAFTPGDPCGLCGGPMTADDALDLDHATPLALGGNPNGPRRLVHARCNRSAGGRLGAAQRRGRAPGRPQLPEGERPGWFDLTDPERPSRRSQQWHDGVAWLGEAAAAR